MQISILKPGILSTMQDMGRYGYLSQGVPVSGAMDTLSARMANMALGNHDNDAVIEFTYAGAAFKADTDLLIAYAGEGAVFKTDHGVLQAGRPVFIPGGTVVRLMNNPAGSRTYLAIAGGWRVDVVLGSRSTYLTAAIGGWHGRALQTGDVLNSNGKLTRLTGYLLHQLSGDELNDTDWCLLRKAFVTNDQYGIRLIRGAESDWFDEVSTRALFTASYTLSLNSNRMGYHLEGVPIRQLIKKQLLSTAVTPGTIQVTGNGSMVLLMADCQTTGGYPRIGQVAAVDIPVCAQLKPGDSISFKEISRHEAETLYIEREQQLHKLALAIKGKFA